MKLSTMTDEELREVASMKKRNGCATSEALRAQQILFTRNIGKHNVTGHHNQYDFSKDYN
ncbi:MAG: hypothetical protein RR744_09875 [Cellulosilyticaceae bacterium]